MFYALFWYATLPIRLAASALYWTQFRLGGKLRARMTSIEIDNRMHWEKTFSLEQRLAGLEAREAANKVDRTTDLFTQPMRD